MIGVSQPAVSRMLRDLQAALGMRLFDKRGTGLVPTPAASSLYLEVDRSFVGLDRIAAAAEEIKRRRTGTLRIVAMPALACGILPRFAGHFLAARPNLGLAMFGVISPTVVDWVVNQQSDLGFAESVSIHAGLDSMPMPILARVAILPLGHRLARKRVLRPQDFQGETFISLTASSLARSLVDRLFVEHGVNRILRIETTLSEIMCGLVSSGVGVALCDPLTALEFSKGGIVARPFLPQVDFTFAAVFPPQRTRSPVAEEFANAFSAHIEGMLAGCGKTPCPARLRFDSVTPR